MINWCGVFVSFHRKLQNYSPTDHEKWYGWVETVGGFLKVCLVLGTSLLLYVIAGEGEC